MYEYKTKGTCSKLVRFNIKDRKIHSVHFEGGCDGNLKALSILIEGMDISLIVEKLKGNLCEYKNTSCADQLARAVEQYL